MQFTVKFDDRALRKALKEYPKIAAKSAVSAINKTAAQVQTAGVRKLASEKALPVRVVKARTSLLKARYRRVGSTTTATVVARTLGVPIDALPSARVGKRGVTAARQKFPHAFQAIMPSGKRLIVERKVIGGKRAGRLPLERVKIPLEPDATNIFKSEMDRLVGVTLPRIFASELAYRLGKSAR